MYKQKHKQYKEKHGGYLVNDGKSYDTVNIHDHDSGNQRNTVKHSHNDLESGDLPGLFGCSGISSQDQNSYYRSCLFSFFSNLTQICI